LTPKKHEDFEHDVKLDVEARVRQGVKAVLEEEMTQHLQAGYRDLTPTRRGERNGYYQRNLVTPAGKIERLEVPRDREGEFVTELLERYKRMTEDVEEAVLEMYLSGISVRKIAGVTDALSKVRVGKDPLIDADWMVVCIGVRTNSPRCYALTPDEVSKLATRDRRSPNHWLEQRHYDAEEFAERWDRMGSGVA
jgi:Transposase, Mutator family